MARTSIQVDKEKLTKIVVDLESKNKYPTQSALFKAVSEVYGDEKVTPSVVMLRIKQFGITIKTEKAKISPEVFRERLNNAVTDGDNIKPKQKQTVNDLLEFADKNEKMKFTKLARSVLRGGRKSAIKMMCMQCCNWSKIDVKLCESKGCALWLYRPYQ